MAEAGDVRVKLTVEADELRAVIREAHEATSDLRAVLKELRTERDLIPQRMAAAFEELAGEQVKSGLVRYRATLDDAIKSAEAAIQRRFDTIANILLGEDPKSKRKGEPSLADYAERIAEARREQP